MAREECSETRARKAIKMSPTCFYTPRYPYYGSSYMWNRACGKTSLGGPALMDLDWSPAIGEKCSRCHKPIETREMRRSI